MVLRFCFESAVSILKKLVLEWADDVLPIMLSKSCEFSSQNNSKKVNMGCDKKDLCQGEFVLGLVLRRTPLVIKLKFINDELIIK